MIGTMGRSAARALSLLILVAGLVTAGGPAHACSCAPTDLDRSLPEADGAFVGILVERSNLSEQLATFTFEVERVVKGEFGPTAIVRSNAYGASCGLEFFDDPRTGLLLDRADDGVWESSLCQQVPPDELLAYAGNGRPPDPDVAPIGARVDPVWLVAGMAIIAVALAFVALFLRARRSAASRGGSAVA